MNNTYILLVLVNILTKPKNALTKQYKKLLKIDGVDLSFEDISTFTQTFKTGIRCTSPFLI